MRRKAMDAPKSAPSGATSGARESAEAAGEGGGCAGADGDNANVSARGENCRGSRAFPCLQGPVQLVADCAGGGGGDRAGDAWRGDWAVRFEDAAGGWVS